MGSTVHKKMDYKDKKFIDYPFLNYKNFFLDIYLMSKCEFCITTGTGMDSVPALFRRPIISVNFSDIKALELVSGLFRV